ncbi:MAG TPA: glycosyltransferase [Gemmatimonadaceae bacterium]|nr:glycosyltransferase [Gemmatimonadaceae bacterium]
MRVLLVTHSYPRRRDDPAGVFIHRLARALADGGAKILVLAPSAPGLAPEERIDGVPVKRFRYAPLAWETLAYTGTMAEQVKGSLRGKAALMGMLWRGRQALAEGIRSFTPDVIHAHWWFPSGLSAVGVRGALPLVTTLHGSDVRLARANAWAPFFFRRVASHSAAVTAVSSWLAGEARALAPGLEVSVEPMPVDVALFSPGGPRRAAGFAFVGRLNAQKGIGVLLEALAASRAGASLDVVGDGPDRPALEARARSLGLGSRVAFHGVLPQRELIPLYRAATAVIVPSEREGLGLVAVEAQLCEAPVVAFRSGGLTDVVIDGETGLLVAPGDVGALAGAMDAVLARADRGAALGRAGRAAALGRFSPDIVAVRYRALYERVCASVA